MYKKLADLTMSNIGAPSQHSQSSRKGKKAWRKNIDVTAVQDGLDNLRDEMIAGGPMSEKKDDDLFAVDTAGSSEIAKKYKLRKPLKVDEILAQRSAVPAVDSRKRPLPDGVYEKPSKRHSSDWVTTKDLQKLKKSINTVSHLPDQVALQEDEQAFDLWSIGADHSAENGLEYVPKRKSKVAPSTIKRAPIPMTASGKRVSAVPHPVAGTSYNPDFDEWQNLVVQEGEKAVIAEKTKIEADQRETERQARIRAANEEKDYAIRTDDESAWEGFETENEDMEALRKKRPTRKTPAERNKAKRKKAAERLLKHEKRTGEKQKQAVQVDSVGEHRTPTPTEEQQHSHDEEPDDGQVLRRRQRGNVMIPERNLEVVLEDELQDSLRLLKPEGNLLQDRFRNLLVNGKLESRKPIAQARKKRVKYTEKWSHKDFSIEV